MTEISKQYMFIDNSALGGSNVGKNLYKKGVLNESQSLEEVTSHPDWETSFQKLTYTLAMKLELLARYELMGLMTSRLILEYF